MYPGSLTAGTKIGILTVSSRPAVTWMAMVSHTSEKVWRITVSMESWLPSLCTPSVGGSRRERPAFTAPKFTFLIQDWRTSGTNPNIITKHRSRVSWHELTFPGSRSFPVYSLWLVPQAASSNEIFVLPTIKGLDGVYLRCPFALGPSGPLAGHSNYEKWQRGVRVNDMKEV